MTWRQRLRPASFRAVAFHVDESEIGGGRRVAPHEYPKRNVGFAEDMGRRMRAYRVRAYLIGENYDLAGRLLVAALEADGSGLLVLPVTGEATVLCASFTYVETKDEGGYATLDMDFLEAGSPAQASVSIDTESAVHTAADAAKASIADSPMNFRLPRRAPQLSGGQLDFSDPDNSGLLLFGW